MQFTLRPLAVDEITKHLGAILEKEQITADQDAIWQIAESAQGSLRDALSLTTKPLLMVKVQYIIKMLKKCLV